MLVAIVAVSCVTRDGPPATPETRPPPADHARVEGRVLSRRTAGPVAAGGPLLVLATPHGDAGERITAPLLDLRREHDAFHPQFLVASVDQPIRITNAEDICHRFFSKSPGHAFDLGLQNPGDTTILRFGQPGLVHVYCELHDRRQAAILVTAASRYTVVDPATGRFEVAGISRGTWSLETWHETLPAERCDVSVPAIGRTGLEIFVDDREAAPNR